jgi:pimeloyl-ACP methyl ester carboxylesterase
MDVGKHLVATMALVTVLGAAPVAQAAQPAGRQPAAHDLLVRASNAPDRRGAAVSGRRNFAKRIEIRGGRRLFLECRGTGSPTVVLEAGTGDLADVWKMPPTGPGAAVLPAVARFTRVCAYDRPGTYLPDGRRSRSDPVAMPRSARDIVADLRALLSAADVPGPYVLVGHSFGGMVARLYATLHPGGLAGLVSVDAQNEDFVEAYQDLLTPEQYLSAVLDPQPPPGMESYAAVERLSLETSAAQMRQAQADTPLRRMPVVVVSHSRDLWNPFGFPSGWPQVELERAFQGSQDMLAALVPGARHWVAARSGHYIQLDQPRLVTRAIRSVVREQRSARRQASVRQDRVAAPRGGEVR